MTTHLKMDEAQPRLLDETAQGVIGKPFDRPERPLKVTGIATYAAEYRLPGMVEGLLVRATITKGRMTALNDERVRRMPGVLGVWSGERFLRNPAQGGAGKAPVQGAAQVHYFGQAVARAVAETYEQARHATQALRPSFEAEAADIDPETASKVDKPRKSQLDQGALKAAMAAAAHTVAATYTTRRIRARRRSPMPPSPRGRGTRGRPMVLTRCRASTRARWPIHSASRRRPSPARRGSAGCSASSQRAASSTPRRRPRNTGAG